MHVLRAAARARRLRGNLTAQGAIETQVNSIKGNGFGGVLELLCRDRDGTGRSIEDSSCVLHARQLDIDLVTVCRLRCGLPYIL